MNPLENLVKESEMLELAAIELRLKMSPEQRILAHENALRLMRDLRQAGGALDAESQESSRTTVKPQY